MMKSGRLKTENFDESYPRRRLNQKPNWVRTEPELSPEAVESPENFMGRLYDLQLGGIEVDLSEELQSCNDLRQQDELLAIESIYGDNVHVLDKYNGFRSFQVDIHVEIGDELDVCATAVLNESDESYFFKVQHLPPIVLTCILPRSYPSHSPPCFNISVQWLDSSKISSLCTMLDSLWNEQPGEEILYQWVEWLHASSLSHLGFDKPNALGVSDFDITTLKSYNEDRLHESFLADVHECCICFSQYAGTDFVRLPCDHFFCTKCMGTYADMHIKEGTVNKLHCMNGKCKEMVPPGLLKRLLGNEEFERWEALMLQKTLDSMIDVVYCPRCETACIEDEEHHAQCSKCLFSFCTYCSEKRHLGIECTKPEKKLRILQERQNSSQLGDEQKRKEKEVIKEILNVMEILQDAKQCPWCKMGISKVSGCNKMVCKNCGKSFCYGCNQAIDGYDHLQWFRCGF